MKILIKNWLVFIFFFLPAYGIKKLGNVMERLWEWIKDIFPIFVVIALIGIIIDSFYNPFHGISLLVLYGLYLLQDSFKNIKNENISLHKQINHLHSRLNVIENRLIRLNIIETDSESVIEELNNKAF